MAEPIDGPPTTATFDEDHNPFLPPDGEQENGYDDLDDGGDAQLAEEYDDQDGDMEMMDHEHYDGGGHMDKVDEVSEAAS